MDSRRVAERLKSAEAYDFLPIPIPVPPTIELAFKYRGRSQYVDLGFGVKGGVMGDMIRDSVPPEPRDLYRRFLLHPSVKPYTDAFRIETDPPEWLIDMNIADFEEYETKLDSWWNQSRCLLLDRQSRRFFVSTVAEVRNWLMFRGALFASHSQPRRRLSADTAVKELFQFLDTQPIPTVSDLDLQAWDARFNTKRAIEACVGAAFRLGFKGDEVLDLMLDAFHPPDRDR